MTCILIVEDHDLNRDMLSRRLKRRGFQVVAAADGAAGVEAAVRERPDLVLMDMSLPVVDGWQATRMIKANPETSAIPVMALTAHALKEDRERALEAGCDEFETKPVDLDRLLTKIDVLLSKVRLVEQPMSDVAAAHRELIRLAACMAESSASVLAASDQITDEEDLKMLEWISASIAAFRIWRGRAMRRCCGTARTGTPSATASTPSRVERSC